MPHRPSTEREQLQAGNVEGLLLPEDGHAATSDWEKTLANLMSLARQANQNFDYDRAVSYLCSMEDIWNSKGLPEFSTELRIELHREKGKAYASLGRNEDAINEYKKILQICRDTDYLPIRSETFVQIGQLLAKQGDHDRALGYLQRAIGAYRRTSDREGMCKALRNLGVIYLELGEFEEAEITYDEAIDIAHEIGNRMLFADLVNNLGAIMNMKGNGEKALELYRKSLLIYEENNEIRKSAYTKNNLAITLTEQGMDDEAFDHFREAYEIARSIKDAALILIVDINLADLYLKKGLLVDARRHCRKAEEYLVSTGATSGHLVEVRKIAGKLARREEDYDSALKYFGQALEISRQINTQFLEAEVLLERGILYRMLGRHFDALNDLEQSYHIYNRVKADGKKEQTEKVIDSIETLYLQVFNSMAHEVDRKDKYTKGHSDRVASLALLLAKELGFRPYLLKTVVAAGLLHDIGKIKIDDAVLNKAGRLSKDEYKHIQNHPALGVELLQGKEFPWDIKPLILYHHERIDGKGYPEGRKGEDIPVGAKLLCIADVFDALTSDRVYRPAYDTQMALEIMQEDSGTAFDPVLLKCFVNMINQGKADLVINSRTQDDEMFAIWSKCMPEEMAADEPVIATT